MKGIQIKEYVKVSSTYDTSSSKLTSRQGPEDLKVIELPTSDPKPDEYLIAIHASATNFFDLLQIRGKYQHQPPLPWIAGSEFSGVVLKAPTALPGGRTPKYKSGDKVFGASQGGYATHVVCQEEKLKPVPDGWSFFDAAGLFVTAPTSYAALVVRAGIKKGTFEAVRNLSNSES
jgi:NADPH2:quinone reductase